MSCKKPAIFRVLPVEQEAVNNPGLEAQPFGVCGAL